MIQLIIGAGLGLGGVAAAVAIKRHNEAECKAGRLRSQLPEGRKVGRMVRPEWVEQWIEEGTHGIEAA